MKVPPPVRQLLRRERLGLVPRHAVDDVEERVGQELGEVGRDKARRIVPVAGRHLFDDGGDGMGGWLTREIESH